MHTASRRACSAVAIVFPTLTVPAIDGQASDRKEWFDSLKVPGTSTGCCSIADCHRTSAQVDAHGQWLAQLRAEWWPAPRWVAVPPERVLTRPRSIDGEAYVCQTPGIPATTRRTFNDRMYLAVPIDPTVRCFVPPDLGS